MPHVILFYKYAPLSSNEEIMTKYQKAMNDLCQTLKLSGRVLVGLSDDAEGINGTLAGDDKNNVLAFCFALLGKEWCSNPENAGDLEGVLLDQVKVVAPSSSTSSCKERSDAVHLFWKESEEFAKAANIPVLRMDSPEDFKWSSVGGEGAESSEDNNSPDEDGRDSERKSDQEIQLFPDLQIKLVKEIIGTGGVLSSVTISDTSKGYLTPEEWHEEMKKMKDASGSDQKTKDDNAAEKDTVLIDCRNHKEFEIGHFDNALDPNTKTFEQFPRWVQENKSALKDKKILMYCTGGIRCEKASAYMRRELETCAGTASVQHLKGGIHKYLDKYGGEGFFSGSNFVFDRRVGVDADEHVQRKGETNVVTKRIVGHCLYCEKKHDRFTADAVCTVCRELTLICDECKSGLNGEYHCADHQHLKNCYFTNLQRFSEDELRSQLQELEGLFEDIAVGKRYKQKRRTLQRQMNRIIQLLSNIENGALKGVDTSTIACRSCGDEKCDGKCWGVHGLKRKHILHGSELGERPKKSARLSSNKRSNKCLRREKDIAEIKRLNLSQPPSLHRCAETSIRCPPPFTRVLSSSVKGKWVGKSVHSVLQSEFFHFEDTKRVEDLFKMSLVRLNGIPVNSEAALMKGTHMTKAVSQDTPLKNMDIISRITHWHEPPVWVPEKINVEKINLPQEVVDQLLTGAVNSNDDFSIYCIDKPSSVPVHPTGPYLQNSLTLMVEAQEDLEPRSILPCHRLDRCTSGLTLCCTNPAVARLIQVQMDNKEVEKIYVAKVKGKFTLNDSRVRVLNNNEFLFEAPIDVIDVKKGIRAVSDKGKPAVTKFSLLGYDRDNDHSLVECQPLTGRQHQLRVHLQALGFPIHNDVLYNENSYDEQKSLKSDAIKAVKKSIENEVSHPITCDGVSADDTLAAKKVCLCCQGLVEKEFNSSQLLGGGAVIDLHARKYLINFKKKQKDGKGQSIGLVECRIGIPAWASNFRNTEKAYDVVMLTWLKENS